MWCRPLLLQNTSTLLHSLRQGQEAKSDTQLRVRTCFTVKFPSVSLCPAQFSLSQPLEGKGREGNAGWLVGVPMCCCCCCCWLQLMLARHVLPLWHMAWELPMVCNIATMKQWNCNGDNVPFPTLSLFWLPENLLFQCLDSVFLWAGNLIKCSACLSAKEQELTHLREINLESLGVNLWYWWVLTGTQVKPAC